MRQWLVVDDEIADTFILRRAIKELAIPVQIRFFESGAGLVDYVSRDGIDRYELILVDINMPQTDGFEVVESLRETSAKAGVHLIMYSNTKNEADSLRAYQTGASGFVSKPSTFFEAKTIVNLLDTMTRA